MRLSELLGKSVVGEDDTDLGIVHDVAAVQDGEDLRVEALLIGVRGLWARFGVSPAHVRGHPVLARLAGIGRTASEIPWEQVVRVDDDRIVVVHHDDQG
jgi:sporulation protein YlmC with PRC-barrel domain